MILIILAMMWNLYRNFLLHYWKHIKGGKGSHLAIVIVGKLVFFYASKETSAEWTIWYDANTHTDESDNHPTWSSPKIYNIRCFGWNLHLTVTSTNCQKYASEKLKNPRLTGQEQTIGRKFCNPYITEPHVPTTILYERDATNERPCCGTKTSIL